MDFNMDFDKFLVADSPEESIKLGFKVDPPTPENNKWDRKGAVKSNFNSDWIDYYNFHTPER